MMFQSTAEIQLSAVTFSSLRHHHSVIWVRSTRWDALAGCAPLEWAYVWQVKN